MSTSLFNRPVILTSNTDNTKHLGARPDGSIYVHTNKLAFETWTIQDAGDGEVFLVSCHQTHLGSHAGGTVYAHTNRLAWERWRIEPAPEGRVLLTSVAHGLHLGVRPDGSVYTHANTLDWEQWTISPLSPIARYTYTSGGYRVWTDLHSGGNQDVSFFAPYTAGPFRKIGEHVQRSHDIAMHQAVMVLDAQPGILAPPLDYECVWTDKGSGAMFNGSVWRPIPPPGYVALGHVVGGDKGDGYTGPERPLTALVDIYNGGEHANTIQLLHSAISKAGWNKPGLDRIWCVRRDLVTEGDVEFIYEDRGSGAHSDLSCWRVKARAGQENQVIVPNTFVGVSGYDRPDFPVYVLCRRPDIIAV